MIRLVVKMDVCMPLSLWNVADLFFERGVDICRETMRYWWNRFGPKFGKFEALIVRALASYLPKCPVDELLKLKRFEDCYRQHS